MRERLSESTQGKREPGLLRESEPASVLATSARGKESGVYGYRQGKVIHLSQFVAGPL
jgi:hypothetical protein